jgi:hypothetical protein
MRIADGTSIEGTWREGCEIDEGGGGRKRGEGARRNAGLLSENRQRTRRECAGGPNPPAVRSYRRNMHFSRNNPQRLEKRLIDCPAHDFACKGASASGIFPRDLARVSSC